MLPLCDGDHRPTSVQIVKHIHPYHAGLSQLIYLNLVCEKYCEILHIIIILSKSALDGVLYGQNGSFEVEQL